MCVVSMIIDHYNEKWYPTWPNTAPNQPVYPATININSVSREEFEALKRDVEEMKKLLIRAKEYDEKNNEPDCEMEDKVVLIKRLAELVGVNLDDVLKG